MNLIEFFNEIYFILTGTRIADIDGLFAYYSNIEHWVQVFNPVMFLSTILYIFIGWFIIQFTMILPVRYIKKIIRFPSRKGSEK